MAKLNREEAIDYLTDKDVIEGIRKFSKKEENEIKKVIKEGKIYGDPVVSLKEY